MKQPRKKPKPRKANRLPKKGTAAIQLKEHAGNPATTGHDARLLMYKKRAIELRALDHTLLEIAQMIYVEFQMERPPSLSTVHNWLESIYQDTKDDLLAIHWTLRFEQFKQLEKMKLKWLAVANADELAIRRWVRTKEGEQPTLDENAVAEQLKATEAAVKIMARQARLFGLDLEQAIKDGEGPQGDMHLWVIQQVAKMGMPAGGPIVDEETSVVLELTSGIEGI